ncbi:MAG: hypothetical protein AAF648_16945 [Pseudomonadota bacterium]
MTTAAEQARAELEQINSKKAELETQIQHEEALLDLRSVGRGLGLDAAAPIDEFVDDFIASDQSAEAWLRQQTVDRPYWFDAPVTTPTVAALSAGDPFEPSSFSLAKQRDLLRTAPDIAQSLLARRGWRS